MKKIIVSFLLFGAVLSCFAQKQLFNGTDMKGWDIFIGNPIKGFENLKEKATPESVYSLVEMDGQKVIRISGDVNAALATNKEFGNYHLRLEFKWGEKVYGTRNSGLLYHSFGDFGAALGTWMACIEHQLMHDRLGDTYLMNNTYCETSVKKLDDGKFQFSKDGETEKFGEAYNGRNITKATDAEKPLGEWNTVDLYCYGNTSIHVVNGKVVMLNRNCSKIEDGKLISLTKGKIQIQSEGAELFVRKVEVEKIKELPMDLCK
ncbi:MAG: hypothetical protein A2W90_12300 [Bacteroidetes bacterium GWF2_42_66]|nr:MAG: hypothetical protein A2W92_23125 [Bacteroidetes bacterium GWA2_42_15]OFX99968.1 MAG: hypothetical protein A2W89_17285 [Bacteroidetes bacterium GWE2_42_39]OFY40153.1 MAG: hypothetical protein A2W90_12300 [Bacteroidetes bacterium GWF2_42_66]HBL73981.1 DUF1080 domain-containing protein [Prolixibacteraceae bacterium]HCR89208.1 DUF1080 domain-containing protein [Prolixibacteraceae bacterium]